MPVPRDGPTQQTQRRTARSTRQGVQTRERTRAVLLVVGARGRGGYSPASIDWRRGRPPCRLRARWPFPPVEHDRRGEQNVRVAITNHTRKILWSLSGNACARCGTSLVRAPDAVGDVHAIVGRECHIVAQAPGGPRGRRRVPRRPRRSRQPHPPVRELPRRRRHAARTVPARRTAPPQSRTRTGRRTPQRPGHAGHPPARPRRARLFEARFVRR